MTFITTQPTISALDKRPADFSLRALKRSWP